MTTYTKNKNPYADFHQPPKKRGLKKTAVDKLPKKITKEVVIPKVKRHPVQNITTQELTRKNHESHHIEKGDYKVTYRWDYVDETNCDKYGDDKIGKVYCTRVYYIRTPSLNVKKGYKYEQISAREAKKAKIYEAPEFVSQTTAKRQINGYRQHVNPRRRMTDKYQ